MFQNFDAMLAEAPWRGVWGAEPPSKPLHHHFLQKKKSQFFLVARAMTVVAATQIACNSGVEPPLAGAWVDRFPF